MKKFFLFNAKLILSRLSEKNLSRASKILLFMFVRSLYDIFYVYILTDIYASNGYILDAQILPWLLSWSYYSVAVFLVQNETKNYDLVKRTILSIFLIWIIMPASSVYGYNPRTENYIKITLISLFVVRIFFEFPIQGIISYFEIKLKKIKRFSLLGKFFLWSFCAVPTFLLLLRLWYLNGTPSLIAANILRVYDVRRSVITDSMISYLRGIVCNAVFPVVVCHSIRTKKRGLAVVSVLVEIIIYLYLGNRSIFFSLLFTIAAYFFFGKLKSSDGYLPFVLSIILVILFATMKNSFISYIIISIIRRALSVPAQVGSQYIEFSDQYGYLWYSQSRISNIMDVQSQYPLPFPYIIGLNYFGYPTSANNGYIASGYSDAGIVGVLIASILVSTILLLIYHSLYSHKCMLFGIIGSTFALLTNSNLLTTLFTHGLGALVFLVLLYSLAYPNIIVDEDKYNYEITNIKKSIVWKRIIAGLIISSISIITFSNSFVSSYNNKKEPADIPHMQLSSKVTNALAKSETHAKLYTHEYVYGLIGNLNNYELFKKESLKDSALYIISVIKYNRTSKYKINNYWVYKRLSNIISASQDEIYLDSDTRYWCIMSINNYIRYSDYYSFKNRDDIISTLESLSEKWLYLGSYTNKQTLSMAAHALLETSITLNYKNQLSRIMQASSSKYAQWIINYINRDIGILLCYDNNGFPLDFTSSINIISPLIEYIKLNGNFDDVNLSIDQIRGSIAIFLYKNDTSLRETSMIENMNFENAIISKEDSTLLAIHLLKKIGGGNVLRDLCLFYETSIEKGDYNNTYCILYYITACDLYA